MNADLKKSMTSNEKDGSQWIQGVLMMDENIGINWMRK